MELLSKETAKQYMRAKMYSYYIYNVEIATCVNHTVQHVHKLKQRCYLPVHDYIYSVI